jgi:hypothetical protein
MVDSRELRVEGFRVDEIEEVLPCPWEGQDHTTDSSTSVGIAMLLMWEMKCLELSQRVYHPKSEVPAAHWQTLIANKHSDNTIYTGDGREVYDLLRIRLRKKMTDQLSETQPQNLALQDYAVAFGYASHGRSFFSTKGGRIGLGSQYAKRGDVICIFYNGVTPFIVRSRKEDSTATRNEFIGESYVHGLMYGEGLKEEGKHRDSIFVLV